MISKSLEKEKAVALRKEGLSYKEILEKVPVAKSSLSLWLKSIGLSKSQKQRLTDKKLASARRGALKKKEDRILKTRIIKENAEEEVKELTERERWLVGIALYWAEGSKEKEWAPGSRTQFTNSDPNMIKFYLNWLFEIVKIPRKMVNLDIYIRENHKNRLSEVVNYWSKTTGFPKNNLNKIYFKRNKINTNRKNVGVNYYGILRITVHASSELNRRISGWINGIIKK